MQKNVHDYLSDQSLGSGVKANQLKVFAPRSLDCNLFGRNKLLGINVDVSTRKFQMRTVHFARTIKQ